MRHALRALRKLSIPTQGNSTLCRCCLTCRTDKRSECAASHLSTVIYPVSFSSAGDCQELVEPPPGLFRDQAHCADETTPKNGHPHFLAVKSTLCILETMFTSNHPSSIPISSLPSADLTCEVLIQCLRISPSNGLQQLFFRNEI